MDAAGSGQGDKAGEDIGEGETTPDGSLRSLIGDWKAFVGSHRLLFVWPIVVFVVALGIIVSLAMRAPAAPFIYTR